MEILNDLAVKAGKALSNDATADLVERIATKAAYTASGITVVSGLTVNEWGVIVGSIAATVTAAFNIWFKMKYQRPEKR